MVFHDFLANSKPNAGAGIFIFAVKPLKHIKYALFKPGVDAYPIIFD